MHIAPIYAALLALIYVGLSFMTLGLRKRLQIAVGDGGNVEMLRAMRVHANFAEYVPISLLLIHMVELQGAQPLLIHALGSALLLGRLAHAYGVRQVRENFRFRIVGMVLTFATLIVAAISLLGASLRA
jgi:uncharacterized membrane protein YecN with MAPEG domain